MVQEKCKKGFKSEKGKCVKTTCNLDGKDFCKQGDKSLKPMISRPGGKSQLADRIIKKAPPHKTYVEPNLLRMARDSINAITLPGEISSRD